MISKKSGPSAVAQLRQYIQRIQEREPIIQAWEHVDHEHAHKTAQTIDDRTDSLPLGGLPLGIKDTIDVAGMPGLLGDSEIYAGRIPTKDAPVVTDLRAAGAVIIGKTAVSRHGVMVPGKTRNPRDTSRSPGASSSGSAAAVADRMIPASIGSQTAGSILRPASYCGVVGFKPTKGAISTDGMREYSRPLDTVGCLARDVMTARAVLRTLMKSKDTPFSSEASSREILLYRGGELGRPADYMHSEYERIMDRLARYGFEMSEFEPGDKLSETLAAQQTIMAHDVAETFSEHIAKRPDYLAPALLNLCKEGAAVGRAQYADALETAQGHKEELQKPLADGAVILTFSTATDAPPRNHTGTSEFIAPWTLLGFPSVHVPTGVSRRGMPIGVQLVAGSNMDISLLDTAEIVERFAIT